MDLREHMTPSNPDAAIVERWLDELEAQSLGPRGRVALLVETPRPHEHETRESVTVEVGRGFAGDHGRKSFYLGKYVPGREVSAIAFDTLRVLGVDPVVVGDNLITEGFDLGALEGGDRVRVGRDVILARSPRAHRPCKVFRERTSPEAYAVVRERHWRGALFVVERGGTVHVGDEVVRIAG